MGHLIAFINSWVQGIIVAVILATIIEIILPEGNNKKYVKTIIGIYIMFVIVGPLISKMLNKDVNIESIMQNTTSTMSKLETNNNITIETNAYIEKTYKQKLEEDIKNKSSEKGYNISFLNLAIETGDSEEYGQINSIAMKIDKIDKSIENEREDKKGTTNNTIDNVETVQISVSDNKIIDKNDDVVKNTNISENEIETFKEYLSNVYGISKDKIQINE